MRGSQWYQSLEELMEKSTYWSSVGELCKCTWSDQFRRFQGSILLLLASWKIKEGELIGKMDWKSLEQWFWSCRKVSYGASLAERFWSLILENLEEYGRANFGVHQLASGKIKEGELREKLDWKRVEKGFWSCWILSCQINLAGCSGYLSLGNWMG